MVKMKKTVYTMSINNEYAPDICAITFPLLKKYAEKIEADFFVIHERKFPDWPFACEKFQLYELAKEHKNDWSIFFDADTLVHPDFFDVTSVLSKDMTCSNGTDFSLQRFKADEYFLRDGRFIGKGNWLGVTSDWCLDYWKPLDDITQEEAISRITPTYGEQLFGITSRYLLDDYIVSRNIAKYGLKHMLISNIEYTGLPKESSYLYHQYLMHDEQKVVEMERVLKLWNIDKER
jgi:hypothetical protein